MQEINTRGLDIFLVILRHLISFGYNLGDGTTPSTPRSAAEGFFRAANMEMGWNKRNDWLIKRALTDQLEIEDFQQLPTFLQLLDHKYLLPLVRQNVQYRLIGPEILQISSAKSPTIEAHRDSSITIARNRLSFDDTQALAESITAHFNSQDGVVYTGLCPRFLHIEYKVHSGGRDISDVRRIEIEIPVVLDEGEDLSMRRMSSVYILASVVRVSVGKQERVRLYANTGQELPPAEIGDYRVKEPEAAKSDQWSISYPGRYVLFFYLDDIPEGVAENVTNPMDLDAPEYVERHWVERDNEF